MMSRIVIFSDLYLPTFPQLELPLYSELKESVETHFVMQEHDYRLVTPELSTIFSPIVTVIRNPKKDILDIVSKNDLCIMRFGYKGIAGDIASVLRTNKRKLLMLDPAAVDLKFRECVAQYITAKSEWMRQCVIKKFPGRYKGIFPVGTIHFDSAYKLGYVDKKKLMESYGLDPNKKLVILTPANPAEATHQKGVDEDYGKISRIVQGCSDYEMLIKAHPSDYSKKLAALPGVVHKFEYYGPKYSWELFAPGAKVVRPAEGYQVLSCADVVLNVRSSISMEVPFFDTPLVNVNRHKYVTNWPASNNPGIMQDVKLEDLESLLKSCQFQIDKKARKEYAIKFCDPYCDGLAYKRTADVAINLLVGS
jgi:hypothetical protein